VVEEEEEEEEVVVVVGLEEGEGEGDEEEREEREDSESLAGTRYSLAPSGEDWRRMGVSISVKSWKAKPVSHQNPFGLASSTGLKREGKIRNGGEKRRDGTRRKTKRTRRNSPRSCM